MKKAIVIISIVLITVLGLLFCNWAKYYINKEINKEQVIKQELLTELKSIKDLPDASRTSEVPTAIIKSSNATVGYSYNTNESFNSIKEFYDNELSKLGWSFSEENKLTNWGKDLGEKELTWKKGKFTLSLHYAGEKPQYGWIYGINVSWHSKAR